MSIIADWANPLHTHTYTAIVLTLLLALIAHMRGRVLLWHRDSIYIQIIRANSSKSSNVKYFLQKLPDRGGSGLP